MSTPNLIKDSPISAGSQDHHDETIMPQGHPWLRHLGGLAAGVVAGLIVYFIFPKELSASLLEQFAAKEMDTSATNIAITAGIAVMMGVWWMTEAIPLAATALVPVTLFPIFGIMSFKEAGGAYASSTIFLFMGGFFLALAMQRWNFHRRLALTIVRAIGTKPTRLVLGFMVATGFLSMWVSNTATAVMMLPIGISVLSTIGHVGDDDGPRLSNFGTALMLGIAYAASIASLSTLIGTPPNALLRGYLQDTHDITLSFGKWMLFATPMAWLFLLVAWQLLVRVYKPEVSEIPGGKELIERELRDMGPMSAQEKIVGLIFVAAAAAWIIIPTFWPDGPISDSTIAMILAMVLFITPAKPSEGVAILDWETAKHIPWDVLLLFGGGLSLSAAFGSSGLSAWIGEVAGSMAGLPTIIIIAGVAAIVIFLTEMTSNTATAAAFLPIIGAVAIGMGVDVQLLVIPVALAATCAFMLPVATPPNAIAYGSGYISIAQMVKAGLWLNILGIVMITVWTLVFGPMLLGFSL
ncbi:SLC13 family permease [Trueperella bernardiae]|uniref:Sodium-dependent dicarboxylate transporter SdcS n=1 Tax=Trueperella bernardiae TaxID=59561 RepID=A0AAW6ZLZ0_9ACTO|nr:DASS family sodium-coupled anion symporter [Trueperella bernardiae]MCM3906889.1 DASS family sodium-coupled anion symporter [Trueperella bernardiae]MDK8601803.1 DASS family sodium-coupled anion symporter [Trueperella bernardiae]MDV6238412.1 DASS family sodium-coupled anion symporter [Trueperella bernardiae]